MKLLLPNGRKIYLPDTISLEEKMKIVNGIIIEWEDYFRASWNTPKTKACLSILATYLCRGFHRDKNVTQGKRVEDPYVWSKKKEQRVKFGDGITILFSEMSTVEKIQLGIPHCYNEEIEEKQE